MKKNIKISDLKQALKEEFINEFCEGIENNFWGDHEEKFDPSEIESVSNIVDENNEYSEMLDEYIGELYDMKTRIEGLLEKLTYFDETNEESFAKERSKLVEALQIITDLYNN